MDKKYLNGILIIFLIVIWGSVVYKYFVKESIVLQENTINISNSTIDYAIAKDTFTLKLTSRDPFKASKRRIVKNNKQTSTYTIAVNKNMSAKNEQIKGDHYIETSCKLGNQMACDFNMKNVQK